VAAAGEATRVTKGATRIERPAVYPQRIRTLSTPPTRRMRPRPTSRSCLKSLSENLRTVEVSAVAPTFPDSKRPIAHERYEQSFQVHGARAQNKFIANNEIDNHADTTCAGPNWRLVELSGEYCTVSPFSAEYQPIPDVLPIAKCATTCTCPTTGDSIVLVADQVLWFGNDLHCSLINPHQIRAYGYGVCDDPWDPHRPIGIDSDSLFVH
jgi:hypothetical protein